MIDKITIGTATGHFDEELIKGAFLEFSQSIKGLDSDLFNHNAFYGYERASLKVNGQEVGVLIYTRGEPYEWYSKEYLIERAFYVLPQYRRYAPYLVKEFIRQAELLNLDAIASDLTGKASNMYIRMGFEKQSNIFIYKKGN